MPLRLEECGHHAGATVALTIDDVQNDVVVTRVLVYPTPMQVVWPRPYGMVPTLSSCPIPIWRIQHELIDISVPDPWSLEAIFSDWVDTPDK